MSIQTFCIAHKPIEITLSSACTVIWLGPGDAPRGGAQRCIRAGEIEPELETWHPFLGGSAGTFAIESLLRESGTEWSAADRVSILQYRKFVAPKAIGTKSTNYPGMYLIAADALRGLEVDTLQNSVHAPYLLSQPVSLGNLYAQYGSNHRVPDLLRYTAIAVELGIMTWQMSAEFFATSLFVPGGVEMGVYPVPVFLDAVEKMRRVSFEFLRSHRPVSSEPGQLRALAFCNERLGNYFLLRALLSGAGKVEPSFGFLHTVSEGDVYAPG